MTCNLRNVSKQVPSRCMDLSNIFLTTSLRNALFKESGIHSIKGTMHGWSIHFIISSELEKYLSRFTSVRSKSE